jgi:hypothetical protein
MNRWNTYWFRPAPCFDLAIVRILVSAYLIYTMLPPGSSMLHFERLWSLPDQIYDPLTLLRIFLIPWGQDFRPDPEFMAVVYYITLIAAVFSLVGFLTNLSLVGLTVGFAFIIVYTYSHGDFHHASAPLVIALGLLALSPSGRVLSLDHLFERKRSHVAPDQLQLESEFAGWPLRLMQWVFVLMYASAVLSKLAFSGGLEWLNGFTLQYYLIMESLRRGALLGGWLAQHHHLALLLQYFVIGFQATFALAVIFPRLRWVYVPAGLMFHAGNWLSLAAPFPHWMVLYVVFIPWRDAIRWLQRWRQRPALQTSRASMRSVHQRAAPPLTDSREGTSEGVRSSVRVRATGRT